MKRYQDAITDFQHAIELNKKDVESYQKRAESYRKLAELETNEQRKEEYLILAKADEDMAKELPES